MDPVVCVVNFMVNKVAVKAVARVRYLRRKGYSTLPSCASYIDGREVVSLQEPSDSLSCEVASYSYPNQRWFDC